MEEQSCTVSFLFSSEELADLLKLIVGPIEAYLELLNLLLGPHRKKARPDGFFDPVNLNSADVKV